LEAAAVIEDVFLGVPLGEAEIEDLVAVLVTDATGLGAESVDEPGEFGEGGDLEDSEPAGFAFGPLLIGSGGRDRQECLSYWGTFAVAFAIRCFRGRHGNISIISVG